MTTPTEFVLWLNGALGVMDDTPTPEQMAKIREKMSEAIGKITADRLLERADEQIKLDQDRIERDLKAQAARESQMQKMAAEYARKVDEMKYQTLAYGTTGYTPGSVVPITGSPSALGMLTTEPSLLARMRKKIG